MAPSGRTSGPHFSGLAAPPLQNNQNDSTFNSKVMAQASPASPAPKRTNIPSTIRELFNVNNYVRKIKVSELLMGKLTIIKTLMCTKMILMICFRLRLLDCVDYNEM